MKRFLFLSFSLLVTGALAQVPNNLSTFLNSDDLDQCEAKYEANGLTLNKITIIKDSKISQRAYCFSFLPQLSNLLTKNRRIFRLLTSQPFASALHVTDEKKFSYDDREGILTIDSNIDENISAQASKFDKKLEKTLPVLEFRGTAKNLDLSDLVGWRLCHKSSYSDGNTKLSTIKSSCNGKKVLIACAERGSPALALAAMGDNKEVFKNTGDGRNAVNNHNGVDFYFSETSSMGFARESTGVIRNRCDTGSVDAQDRMCWHTTKGFLDSGYRCGEAIDQFSDSSFERLIFTAD